MATTLSRALPRTLTTLAAAGLFGSSLLGAAPVALAQQPAGPALQQPGVPRTELDHSLGLEGVANARDIGGYETADGETVRTGVVFRTGSLDHATDQDLNILSAAGVTHVDDLRTVYERTVAPERIPAGAQAAWYDVLGGSPLTTLVDMPAAYRAFVDGPGANEAFAAVLHDVATSDGAVLYHCSAGKDRTGWATAVILSILGVPREVVTEDFLLSNTYRGADPANPGLNGVSADWLNGAFDAVDRKYGSIDEYVSRGLGLSESEVDRLKERLLTP